MKKYFPVILFILLYIVSQVFAFWMARNTPRIIVEEKVDTLYVCDTITQIEPVYITQRVKEPIYVAVMDTLRIQDSLYMSLPKDELVYTDDSTYYAVISGYQPSLDTMKVFRNDRVITNEKTIVVEKSVPVRKRWSVGATVGPGIIVNPNGNVSAGVGAVVGITYNF